MKQSLCRISVVIYGVRHPVAAFLADFHAFRTIIVKFFNTWNNESSVSPSGQTPIMRLAN